MNKPFKFRYARLLSGLFLASCLALLLMGLLSTGGWHQFWHGRNQRTLLVRDEVTDGGLHLEDSTTTLMRSKRVLVKGARVELLGQTIGMVDELWLGSENGEPWPDHEPLDERCRIIGKVNIYGDFARLVGATSKVTLREDLGGFGGVYLDVSPGTGSLEEAGPLTIGFASSARTKMEDVFEKLKPQVAELGKLIKGIHEDVKPFVEKDGHLQKSLEAVAEIKPAMTQADVTLKSLKDALESYKLTDAQKKNYAATLESVAQVMKALDEGRIETKFPEFRRVEQEFAQACKDLAEACRELSQTNEAAQRTWLLRSRMDEINKEKGGSATGAPGGKPPARSDSKPLIKPR